MVKLKMMNTSRKPRPETQGLNAATEAVTDLLRGFEDHLRQKAIIAKVGPFTVKEVMLKQSLLMKVSRFDISECCLDA
jgi:hypothetical protein